MIKPFSFNYFGTILTATPLGLASTPSDSEVITAACVPLTEDNKVVAVNVIGRGIDIPGGHIDPGETALEAMHRETYEEAYIEVGAPTLIDVLKITSATEMKSLIEKPYMLIYAAKVSAIHEFVVNDEISERLVLSPDVFASQYFADHEYAREMADKAIQAVSPNPRSV